MARRMAEGRLRVNATRHFHRPLERPELIRPDVRIERMHGRFEPGILRMQASLAGAEPVIRIPLFGADVGVRKHAHSGAAQTAQMIGMQVREQDLVHLFRPVTGRAEVLDKASVVPFSKTRQNLSELRWQRAEARIDQGSASRPC